MKKRILSIFMTMVMVVLVGVPSITIASAATDATIEEILATGSYDQESARSMLTLVNGLRTGSDAWYWNSDNTTKTVYTDLKELTYDYALEQIAMQRAVEIVKSFSHTRPDGSNCFTATYEGVRSYGENIAYGYPTVQAAFTGWAEADEKYDGQGHRRNMLKSDFVAIGIACFKYNGRLYWVQEFGYKNSGMGHAHTADDTWHYDGTNHWHECIAGDGGKVDNAAHSGGTANCTKKAVCSVCGQTYGNYGSHTLVKTAKKDATHFAEGNIEYWTCSVCKKLFSDSNGTKEITKDQTVIPVVAHNYSTAWSSDATNHWHECTAKDGAKKDNAAHSFKTVVDTKATEDKVGSQHDECSVCGYKTASKEIPKLPHEMTHHDAVAATCASKGNVEYYSCSNCGRNFSDKEGKTVLADVTTPINSNNHTGNVVVKDAKKATTTEEGYTGDKYCKDCGVLLEKGTVIPVVHHEGPWVLYDEEQNLWYYAVDDVADWTYTGFAENENGTWYVVDGKVNFNVNSVLYDSRDGQKNWKYVRANKFVDTYTGIASNSNGWWRIENGLVNFNATGVFQNENGWWYVKGGQVQFDYTGIKNNAYGWWRIVNGKVDFNATGVYQNELGWWYCKGGQVQFNYTGVQGNEHGWWKIEDGKVNFSFTGIASNANGSWYLKNGKVDFSKNGKVTYQGKTYTIKGGKVA